MSISAFRLIHLRRPAVLSVEGQPFVPRAEMIGLDEIDRRWEALRTENPNYFDGRIYHVLGVHRNGYGGATIHVQDCAYRFHAVQDRSLDLGVRALGVKGIIERGGRFLLGRRSPRVAHYPGTWEFAPGGVVDSGRTPAQVIVNEMGEELQIAARGEPIPIAVLYDEVVRTWEIIFRLNLDRTSQPRPGPEYDEIAWRARDNLPGPLSPIAQQMIRLL